MAERILNRKNIEVKWFHEIEDIPPGVVVVIDAYAATTNIPLILSKNPRHLIIVNEENLRRARLTYPGCLLVGESEHFPEAFFDATNEPESIDMIDVSVRDVVWMSINGSRIFERFADKAEGKVISCAFNNLPKVADWLLEKAQGQQVTIIISGDRGREVLEDKLCGEILLKSLLGKPYDWEETKKAIVEFMEEYPIYKSNYKTNLRFLFDLGRYKEVPICFRNEAGFLELVDASLTPAPA